MQDIEKRNVNCIIVKDLSRFGRNYIETGRYLERIFPFMGVRFIAINDHYDSAEENDDKGRILIPFNNLINDTYCRDISLRVRSHLDVKRKEGQFIGSFAGYGYRKDPKDKNHLIIDEYAAGIVQEIFKSKLNGMSSQRIASHLNELGVLPPNEYKRANGFNYTCGFQAGLNQKWTVVSVNRILKNESYTGTLIQGKRRKINYKVKKSHDVGSENWIRVEDAHDAIISKGEFQQVQQLLELDTRTAPSQTTVYPLSGFLRCADCGQNMIRRTVTKNGKKYQYYHCSTYKNGGGCTPHMINSEKLTESVLAAIRHQVTLLVEAEKVLSNAELASGEQIGISGTSLEHRKGMQQLIEDCKAGKIDLVLTKSIARFARNIVDCLSVIELLKNLNPPVGVKFEADNIYTLDSNGRMILTILASVAEEESHSKSIIMNWSIDRRFSRGLFLTPALLGYDKDEEGNLVINPEEAQTVKVIYYLYLNGYSLTEIATLLMEYSRKTKLGRVEWNPGTLAGVLANERHCGDVLARKTFTPNFLTHKSKKNNNDRTQYRQKNHHEAIVSREVFNAANHLRASRNYSKKNRPLPVLSVVEDGILRGYVPFDKDWTGFSAEEYREASESVMKEPDVTVTADVKKRLDLTGYEIVRVQYFSTMQNPAMTISNGRLRFNTACLKKFENVEYVELLLNSVERCIAIRPCDKNNPNAIRWGRLKEGRWCASTLGCRGLAKTLFDIMEWDEDLRYRFRGQFLEQGDNKMMLFAFDEPEMIKVEEIVLPPKENTEEDEGETVKKKIYIFPPEWAGTFGQPITSIAQVGILRQEHYAGNWDVFRPATEIEEMNIFTAESLNELLREAEKIMEGWTDYR